ncbi:MAG: VTT domain-containing protein [Firmicutes bacterium]|nr:VTT domain-containing protein [Bacillota bacterium]
MEQERKEQLHIRFKRFSAILKLLVLLVIIVAIPLYIYFGHHEIIDQFSSLDAVEAFFEEYHGHSVAVYLIFQVLQIVICVIPGQALQVAAGYLFGFGMGYLWTILGAALGSVLTFYLSKLLGRDAMEMIFGERKIMEVLNSINSKRGVLALFVIYLIPGIPKDICTYAAGLSSIKIKPFLIVSLIGRTPAMMGSLLIGHQLMEGYYTGAIIVGVVAVVLFVLGLIFKDRMIRLFNRAYDKLRKIM